MRTAVAITAALCVVLLAGCSSGAVVGPGGDTDETAVQPTNQGGGGGGSGGGGGGGGGGSGGGGERFSWGLPVGDTSVSLNEGTVYVPLQQGKCAEAQARLDVPEAEDADPLWKLFRSPRNVLLFQVGIYLCSGNLAAARALFERGEAQYGWKGHGEGIVCEVYRASASVIRQKPKSDFACIAGDPPPWSGEYPNLDDPRTAADESTTTTTTTTTTTSVPPSSADGDDTSTETSTSLGGG
jgi:hypothetical protein